MSANVLIVGSGHGSWEIRGKQIGDVLSAVVTSSPTTSQWEWADVCILVKRAITQFAPTAHAFRVPVIWDALDFWKQPDDNGATAEQAIEMGRAVMRRTGPALVIGATQAMANDLGGVYLPHHSRPRLAARPVRERLEVVAYEGTPKYLGSWRSALEQACARLGLTFVVNPPDLSDADLVVAFRGERWDGPICRRWKSGVKCVNALAAGRPLVTQSSAAAAEIAAPGAVVEDPVALETTLASFLPRSVREAVAETCRERSAAYTRAAIARRYRAAISTVLSQTA